MTILWIASDREDGDARGAAAGAVEVLRTAGRTVSLVPTAAPGGSDALDQVLLADASPAWRTLNDADLCIVDGRGEPATDGWLLPLAARIGAVVLVGQVDGAGWLASWSADARPARLAPQSGPASILRAPLALLLPVGGRTPGGATAPTCGVDPPDPADGRRSDGPRTDVAVLARGRAADAVAALADAAGRVRWLAAADVDVVCLPSELDATAAALHACGELAGARPIVATAGAAARAAADADVVVHLDHGPASLARWRVAGSVARGAVVATDAATAPGDLAVARLRSDAPTTLREDLVALLAPLADRATRHRLGDEARAAAAEAATERDAAFVGAIDGLVRRRPLLERQRSARLAAARVDERLGPVLAGALRAHGTDRALDALWPGSRGDRSD